jgi:hypothetical protein
VKFSKIVKQAAALLRDSGCVSYRAPKREFELYDDALEDLNAQPRSQFSQSNKTARQRIARLVEVRDVPFFRMAVRSRLLSVTMDLRASDQGR